MIEIKTPRGLLRDLRADDVDDVHAIVGDPDVTKWLSFDTRSRDQAADMVAGVLSRQQAQPRTEYYLGVCDEAGAFIGFCRLGLTGVRAAKLGYAIRLDRQGQGYATEACRAILAFAFGDLQLHRVTAAIGPDNHASQAVAIRLGFQREGVLRDHVHTNGDWRDSVLYSLLATDNHVIAGPGA